MNILSRPGPERSGPGGPGRRGGGGERPWRAVRSFGGVTFISGLGAVIGLVSNALIAYHFGAGRLTDAFFLAQSIPLVLAHLLQSGPLPSVFLPIFVRVRREVSAEAAWRLRNSLLNFIRRSCLFFFMDLQPELFFALEGR